MLPLAAGFLLGLKTDRRQLSDQVSVLVCNKVPYTVNSRYKFTIGTRGGMLITNICLNRENSKTDK